MNKIKIFIVADEENILNAIKNICQEYDVTVETSPLKAAEIIKYKKFDIVIVDYQMPGVKDHLQSRWLFLNQKDIEGKAFKTK